MKRQGTAATNTGFVSGGFSLLSTILLLILNCGFLVEIL